MTVYPFPAPSARALKRPADVLEGRPNLEIFPIMPRITALIRRHPTPDDFAHGNLIRPFPPRAGRVRLLLADTAAEAARDRLAALRARRAAQEAEAAQEALREARDPLAPARGLVLTLTGCLAFRAAVALVLALLTAGGRP
ncbi:MAG: hypothetical protein ACOYM5_02890 [Caulobacter sp.]